VVVGVAIAMAIATVSSSSNSNGRLVAGPVADREEGSRTAVLRARCSLHTVPSLTELPRHT
jgi:hypothetical protein